MNMTHMATFFNRLGNNWDGICAHSPQKIRMILDKINIHQNARILDVGCGTGILEEYLPAYSPKKIIGVDIASVMIENARNKFQDKYIEFICTDIMDYNNGPFDYVIMYSVFPHLPESKELFPHLHTLTSSAGKLIICHSESRERINRHHHIHASGISRYLPAAADVAEQMKPYFDAEIIEDTNDLYIVIAKHTII